MCWYQLVKRAKKLSFKINKENNVSCFDKHCEQWIYTPACPYCNIGGGGAICVYRLCFLLLFCPLHTGSCHAFIFP